VYLGGSKNILGSCSEETLNTFVFQLSSDILLHATVSLLSAKGSILAIR